MSPVKTESKTRSKLLKERKRKVSSRSANLRAKALSLTRKGRMSSWAKVKSMRRKA
jgi:hypothetical protein